MPDLKIRFTRAMRTASSERYLIDINGNGVDDAVLDLHYAENGTVVGTLIIMTESLATEEIVCEVLQQIDACLLPQVSLEQGNLRFTVVKGQLCGEYGPSA